MLDFGLLQQQLSDMVVDETSIRRTFTEKVAIARQELAAWSDRWKDLDEKAQASRTSWLLAEDLRTPLLSRTSLPETPEMVTIIATDGSQIFPDRHEFTACYLINTGAIVLHYGTGERPILTSSPRVFYRPEETSLMWNGKRIPVNAEIVSAQRGALEMQELALSAENAAKEQRKVAAFTDGTLILWNLEGKPQQDILDEYITSFELMYDYQVPFLGYISRPNSADVINLLRVGLCPENPTNCDRCPYKDKVPELPCEPIEGVNDAILFAGELDEGERSPVFRSSSAILNRYGKHHTYFFYVHVGVEIARIEIPQWVALDTALLDFVHAMAYDQAQKGQGYPVSLAEAHELAIIRGNEREQFYRLLEQLYVRQGLEVALSRKFLKKRNVSI